MLAVDGLTLESFKHLPKDFFLPGAYRKVLGKAADLTLQEVFFESMGSEDPSDTGPVRALRLKFSLPSSSYATMLVREFLKSNKVY